MTHNHQKPLKPQDTVLYRELVFAPEAVANQLQQNRACMQAAVKRVKTLAPRVIITCARGSSDHAATYAKYVFESLLGIVTSSASPSISSIYGKCQNLQGMLYLVISQSGASPDLLRSLDMAKSQGATTMAMVNVTDSPLAQEADIVIPLQAGPEYSVASSKSFIASLTAILHFTAVWLDDPLLFKDFKHLPLLLKQSLELDWSRALDKLKDVQHLYVIGRGYGMGVAQEIALKCKEICGIHAEPFSAAELRHGPIALLRKDFPLCVLVQNDETRPKMDALVTELAKRQSRLIVVGGCEQGGTCLPAIKSSHPVIEPVLQIQRFYKLANELALLRGYNPDQPQNLCKVTETL